MTTNIDIDAIRARVPAVYDGPWYVQPADDGRWLVGYPTDNPKAGLIATVPDYGEHLAEFIAHARQDIPALLAEVAKQTDLKERYARTAANLVRQRDNHAAQADRFSAELAATNAALTEARTQAATYANEIGALTADNARLRASSRHAWRDAITEYRDANHRHNHRAPGWCICGGDWDDEGCDEYIGLTEAAQLYTGETAGVTR